MRSVIRRGVSMLGLVAALSACAPDRAIMAPVAAEPNTRPSRNFTNFNGALRCMDGLLARRAHGSTLISSTDIPDETHRISVGADDMLINAINQMNRSNQRYVFVDQALIKKDGIYEVQVVSETDETPTYYIRGSISQLDTNASAGGLDVNVGNSAGPITPEGNEKTLFSGNGAHTVVTVDLHLVQYPSRRIVPGGSVANSMVVSTRGFRATASGLIEMTGVDATLRVTRIESLGQAVRNLVELGAIELLGRHAKVPYWTCLSIPVENPKQADIRERVVTRVPPGLRITQVQDDLASLGYLDDTLVRGKMDEATRLAVARFQADEGLIPSGVIDFDTLERLRRRQTTKVIRVSPQPPVVRSAAEDPAGYSSLNSFLK